MHRNTKQIDAAKLRRFIAEKNRRWAAAISTTDALLETKKRLQLLTARIETMRRNGKQPPPNELNQLEALNSQIADMAREREEASARLHEMDFVDEAVAYARRLRYSVDTALGVVSPPPVPDDRKAAPTADGGGRVKRPSNLTLDSGRPGSQSNGGIRNA